MSAMVWRLHDAMLVHRGGCDGCGEAEFSPDIEAFELTGKLVCPDCFEPDDGQPDTAQEWADFDPEC
jgi:hypothetical protein